MKTEDLQADKLNLINWISQLDDIKTIKELKQIQSEKNIIAERQKSIVRDRIKNTKTEDYQSWEEIEQKL